MIVNVGFGYLDIEFKLLSLFDIFNGGIISLDGNELFNVLEINFNLVFDYVIVDGESGLFCFSVNIQFVVE